MQSCSKSIENYCVKHKKSRRLQGALPSPEPLLGKPPQTPVIGSRFRAGQWPCVYYYKILRIGPAVLPFWVLSGAHSRSLWQLSVVRLSVIMRYFLMFFSSVFGQKLAAFKWKDAISWFYVSPGSAEALVRWRGKIKYSLIAYTFSKILPRKIG